MRFLSAFMSLYVWNSHYASMALQLIGQQVKDH